jgi:hypothetical protein
MHGDNFDGVKKLVAGNGMPIPRDLAEGHEALLAPEHGLIPFYGDANAPLESCSLFESNSYNT